MAMTPAFTLRLNDALAVRIRAHAAAEYPHECCGALLGREDEAGREVPREVPREVIDLLPLANRREDSRRNRFSLTADDVRAAERAARERGLDVLGWYHSHPDHPALPSEYDRAHAWPWYSYVIVSVERDATGRGVVGMMNSWRLADDRARFVFEAIEAAPGVAAARAEL